MNRKFKIICYLSTICLVFTFGIKHSYAEQLGRLFTTPQERIKLENIRLTPPKEKVVEQVVIEEIDVTEEPETPVDIGGLTVNGLVYRKNGKSTAWVNGSNNNQADFNSDIFVIDEGKIDSDKIAVEIPVIDREVDLKVGETYQAIDEKVIDVIKEDYKGR